MDNINAVIANFHRSDEKRAVKIKELEEINATCQKLMESAPRDYEHHGAWDKIHAFVISDLISRRAKHLLSELCIKFEYADRNCSYRDNVVSFTDALNEVVSSFAES